MLQAFSANPKELESYYLVNESNFQNEDNLDQDLVEELKQEMEANEMNNRYEAELDPDANPYKIAMLNAFRGIEDPFGIEILGQTGGANFDTNQTEA